MIRILLASLLLSALPLVAAPAPKLYIEPQNGYESYISAAMLKKQVPINITANKEDAEIVLNSVTESKSDSTGSKVVKCLFLYCAGIEDRQTASVQIVNVATQQIIWAYSVKKIHGNGNSQSTAEAIAKHLKQFLEAHPWQKVHFVGEGLDPQTGQPLAPGSVRPKLGER